MEVLLVEDDLEDAGLTIETLREGQVPCRVSLVRDGEEALSFLRREAHFARVPRPDLVLLDMQMPKKDGRAVLARSAAIRALPHSRGRADGLANPWRDPQGRELAGRGVSHQAGRSRAFSRRGEVAPQVHAFRRDPAHMIASMHNPRVKQAGPLAGPSAAAERAAHLDRRGAGAGPGNRRRSGRARGLRLCGIVRSEEARGLLEVLPGSGAQRIDVSEAVFAKLAFGQRSEGVWAWPQPPSGGWKISCCRPTAWWPYWKAWRSRATSAPCCAGGRGRCFGLVAAGPRTDLFNPNAIRASLGTIFSLPVAAAAPARCLLGCGAAVFRFWPPGWKGPFPTPRSITGGPRPSFGQRGRGADSLWSGGDVRAIRLPMCGVADSLNVSATAAVLFYEAIRQRASPPLPVDRRTPGRLK